MSPFRAFARDIKIAHTIFSVPFALAAAWLVSRQVETTWMQWAWILVAMLGARSSAMGFNRIADARIDAANPRTQGRAIPSGQLSPKAAWAFVLVSTGVFLLASAMLHPLCLALSPVALAILWGYSLAKRYTALCHLILGLALGLAPLAVWIALTGTVAAPALLLSGAVTTWVAGFDVLYSLQDREFDAGHGLHSIPVALGERGAMILSGLLHLVTAGLLVALPATVSLGWPYWLGVAVMVAMLGWEHWIVRPGDLSRLDQAFFAINGYVSLAFLATIVLAA